MIETVLSIIAVIGALLSMFTFGAFLIWILVSLRFSIFAIAIDILFILGVVKMFIWMGAL